MTFCAYTVTQLWTAANIVHLLQVELIIVLDVIDNSGAEITALLEFFTMCFPSLCPVVHIKTNEQHLHCTPSYTHLFQVLGWLLLCTSVYIYTPTLVSSNVGVKFNAINHVKDRGANWSNFYFYHSVNPLRQTRDLFWKKQFISSPLSSAVSHSPFPSHWWIKKSSYCCYLHCKYISPFLLFYSVATEIDKRYVLPLIYCCSWA